MSSIRFPRFSFLALALASMAVPAAAELADVVLETVADGLAEPVAVTHAGDGRLFVSLLRGRVMVVEDGEVLAEPFIDVTDRVPGAGHGLHSVAFHPDFAATGYVYVHRAERGTGDLLVTRFRAGADGRADAESEVELIRIVKERKQHYGGQVRFGPDGYLYVSTGDDSGTGLIDPECAAQSLDRLEGKILRLDVDASADVPPYYGVPADNPLIGFGRPEVWAHGLRNPWRFSFDRETGDLWIGDVGEADREEVNYQGAASPGGENYGWKVMEGTACRGDASGCAEPVPACHDLGLTPPLLEYAHQRGSGHCSVTGGVVYRGRRVPDLYGRYLFGDYCSGTLWAARREGAAWTAQELAVSLPTVVSFGEDADGEVYLTAEGALYRLADPTAPAPTCVAGANHLCLNRGRFRVSIEWRTPAGETGLGRAVPGGADAGSFWFFGPNNPEVFVKVLDACKPSLNRRFWVFAAGLTNVGTSLVVVDTATGVTRRYDRPLGVAYEAVIDTSAFSTCP